MPISLHCPNVRRRVRLLFVLVLAAGQLILLTACGVIWPSHLPMAPTPAESLQASAALEDIVGQYVRHEQAEQFELRVRFDVTPDRIPEISERSARENARFARALIRRLDWISPSALDESEYLTLLAVRSVLQEASGHALYYSNDLTPFSGGSPLRDIARMMSELPLRDVRDMERYALLLHSLASVADSLRADLTRRGSQGIFLGKSAVARAGEVFAPFRLPSSRNMLRVTPERARTLDGATARRLIAVTDSAIDERIVPAFGRLTTFLAGDYGARGPTGIGLWQYVGGKEYYRALVRRWTTLDVTPEQVHDAGFREVARLDTAMRAMRLRMGASMEGDSLHAAIRRDDRFGAITRDEIVDRMLLAQVALTVPTGAGSTSLGFFPVVVDAANELDSRDAIFGRYQLPQGVDSVGRYTPGTAVLAPGLPILLEALSYFALSPGRHDLLAQRAAKGSAVARWYISVPAYTDAWGLYALDLARERGGLTDLYAAYGALMLESIAAVRLTVDSGIHYFGWTAVQSTEFILRNTMFGEAEAEVEVTRIAHDAPGLGLAAGMGVREIRGVRRWMERELKGDFDEDRFNEELQSLGPVPLRALGSHFEWWLWKERTRLRADSGAAKASTRKSAH